MEKQSSTHPRLLQVSSQVNPVGVDSFNYQFSSMHGLLPLSNETSAFSEHWNQIANMYLSFPKYSQVLGWDIVLLPFFASEELDAKASEVCISRITAPSCFSGGRGMCLVLFLHFVVWIEGKWKLNVSIKIKVPEVHLQFTDKIFLPV